MSRIGGEGQLLSRTAAVRFALNRLSARFSGLAMTISTRTNSVRVAALYKFARLDGFEALRAPLAAFCCGRGIKGTLLLAHEGINGTVAGSEADIAALVDHLNSIEGFAGLEVKYSAAADMPFHRMKVRLKREIVTMGVEDLDPATSAGTYVAPADWNALISDENTIVIDTRNAYEVSIGTFRGAVDPATASFREFPAWAARWRCSAPAAYAARRRRPM
jgi:UPF0176 protein